MRVAVLGGYGVFGARLCRLLVRDGHDVVVAGRDGAKAETLASEIGARPLVVDLRGDLAPLFAADGGGRAQAGVDAVVDCAGPYQSYGDDPYRLARAAIAAGAHYLDLSDDAAFSAGIAELDADARAAGVFALSGASSAPGISSVVAARLAEGLEAVDLVDIAILPGNRAPRGRSVVDSILGQIGAPLRMFRDGEWARATAWTEARDYELEPGMKRRGWLIGVPDLALLPGRIPARAVTFRAGLELGIMNYGLAAIGALRRWGVASDPRRLASPLIFAARMLARFGTDEGGMAVIVTGRAPGGARVARRWRLTARAGEGPFVPAVAARAALRDAAAIPVGARACLCELTLEAVEAAMADLAVETTRDEAPAETLFADALGADFAALPEEVQAAHRIYDLHLFSGRASVERGRGLPARVVAALFRFPPASPDAPVTVEMRRTARGETWTRRFGENAFRSRLSQASPGRVNERFGPFTFELDLPVEGEALGFAVRRGWFFFLPLPRALLPVSRSREYAEDGRFRFDVSLSAPLGAGLIVRYRGWLTPADGLDAIAADEDGDGAGRAA